MALTPTIKTNSVGEINRAIRKLSFSKLGPTSSPSFTGLSLTGLTASRLVATNASKVLVSSGLVNWVAGAANEINVADDTNGGVIIGIVDPLASSKGGTGLDTSGVTNGQLLIGNTSGNVWALASLTGTASQITITPGASSITISLPSSVTIGGTLTAGAFTDGTLTITGGNISGADVDISAGTGDYTSIEGSIDVVRTLGVAIYGHTTGGAESAGVKGSSFAGYGIYGTSGATGKAGYFEGGVVIIKTSTPQLKLIHTVTDDEADFYVDGDGDLSITCTGGDISFGDENLTAGTVTVSDVIVNQDDDTTGFQVNGYDDLSGENLSFFINSAGSAVFNSTANMLFSATGTNKGVYLRSNGTGRIQIQDANASGVVRIAGAGAPTRVVGRLAIGKDSNPTQDLDVNANGVIGGGLTVDTPTLVVDAVNHNVGIGLATVDANYKLIIRRAANVNLGIGLQSSELAIAAFNDSLSANIPMRFYASEFNLLNGSVGINTTTPDTKLQVVGTAGFGDDSGNETLISATGDLSFAGTATVFNDLVLPLDSAKVPAANAPNWESFVGNLNAFAYSVGDFQEFTTELVHGYKEGSDFAFHIHGALNALTAQEEKVQFEIEYTIADANQSTGFGDVFPDGSGSLLTAELVVPNATADLTHVFLIVGVDSAGTFGIDATIKGRIRRIAKSAGGNELTGNIFLTQVGVHYEIDTVGSKTVSAK